MFGDSVGGGWVCETGVVFHGCGGVSAVNRSTCVPNGSGLGDVGVGVGRTVTACWGISCCMFRVYYPVSFSEKPAFVV